MSAVADLATYRDDCLRALAEAVVWPPRTTRSLDEFVLLLADVKDAEVYSQIDGCPPEIAHVAARALARHHAAFADSALFDHPEHAWLTYSSDSPNPEGVIQGVTDAWPGFRETFPELADAALESLVERHVASVHSLMEIPAGRPITLGHGDYRLDNLFLGADGEVTVLHWQLCGKVNFAYDLAYFLTQSLTIGDRRAHEAAIIESYFDELEAAGATHGRGDFMEDYRGR